MASHPKGRRKDSLGETRGAEMSGAPEAEPEAIFTQAGGPEHGVAD